MEPGHYVTYQHEMDLTMIKTGRLVSLQTPLRVHGALACNVTKTAQYADKNTSTEGDAALWLHINIVVHRRKFINNMKYQGKVH